MNAVYDCWCWSWSHKLGSPCYIFLFAAFIPTESGGNDFEIAAWEVGSRIPFLKTGHLGKPCIWSSSKDPHSLLCLLILPTIYLDKYKLMDIHFIIGVFIQYRLISILKWSDLATGSSFNGFLESFVQKIINMSLFFCLSLSYILF